jgi:DNA-binding NarL/FixJ family response regulator
MKVIIADDHPVVRQGLRQMLAVEPDLSVVGEARNGQEVVDLSRRVPWEVAVLDYNMPGKNGLELIKELRQRYPGRAVLILSMYPEDRYAVRALKAGASGYLTKESAPEELVSAIRKVAGGGRYVTPTLGEKLALELEDNRGKPLHETLSDREYQVMWMIASGKTVRQIADELFLSPNTVSTHRTRILRKMNMKSNAELMHYAIAHHLVDVPQVGVRARALTPVWFVVDSTTKGREIYRYPGPDFPRRITLLAQKNHPQGDPDGIDSSRTSDDAGPR